MSTRSKSRSSGRAPSSRRAQAARRQPPRRASRRRGAARAAVGVRVATRRRRGSRAPFYHALIAPMELDPARTVAELEELRTLTGDGDGAQRVAWTDTWETARAFLRAKLEGTGAVEEIDAAGNQWFTLRGASAASGSMRDHEELRALKDRDGIALPDALREHGVELDRAHEARAQL